MIRLKYPTFWSSCNWISLILLPLSYFYRFLGFLRRIATNEIILPQKVVCVGNITVGGSGKTQVVAWLAQLLKQQNISFVIITKAYGSDLIGAKLVEASDTVKEVGDESILLSQFGSVIAAKKLKDSLKLIEQIKPEIVILDDGMQNSLLKKDFQILVFDSLFALGNSKIIPAGPLRENLKSGLAKADLIIMLGNNRCKDLNLIGNIRLSKKPLVKAAIQLTEDFDKEPTYIAFAGIGNPEKFYSLLGQSNFKVKECFSFPDHYNYSDSDLQKLINTARLSNSHLITTEKDYVKIADNYKDFVKCAKVILDFENEQACIEVLYEKLLHKK